MSQNPLESVQTNSRGLVVQARKRNIFCPPSVSENTPTRHNSSWFDLFNENSVDKNKTLTENEKSILKMYKLPRSSSQGSLTSIKSLAHEGKEQKVVKISPAKMRRISQIDKENQMPFQVRPVQEKKALVEDMEINLSKKDQLTKRVISAKRINSSSIVIVQNLNKKSLSNEKDLRLNLNQKPKAGLVERIHDWLDDLRPPEDMDASSRYNLRTASPAKPPISTKNTSPINTTPRKKSNNFI